MWDTDRSAHEIGDRKHFVHFVAAYAQFEAGAQVIADAIVAAQDHGGDKTEELFGLLVQGAILIGLVVEAEKAFEDLVVLRQDLLVHLGAVFVEFGDL